MSFLTNALGGNPFSTLVGSKIEQATDATLASENWALNMEICDLVNETEEGPRDAIRAIKKRLQQNAGKNYAVVLYTLTVLETCVKNCGIKFHILACSKDFVQELVKLIGPKNDPPTAVQEKVLSLIQSWADTFKTQSELSGVVSVYQDLKAKGIEFPATDLDSMAPIYTPQRSVEGAGDVLAEPRSMSSPVRQVGTPVGSLTSEQRAKLQSELDVVQSNMAVLGEMLSELKPGQEQPDELELLQDLNLTCHSMQERLVELIGKLSNDEITAELLRVNDDLNNLFLRYSRWEKNREAGGQSASAVLAKAMGSKPVAQDSLIDLESSDDELSSQLNKLGAGAGSASAQLAKVETVNATNSKKEDEFDMFAQSRNATYENSKSGGSKYADNREPEQAAVSLSTMVQSRQSNPQLREFDEMEAWLENTPVTTAEEAVTSSEFERFLAERAAAVESSPSTATRRSGKGKEDKNGLFAM